MVAGAGGFVGAELTKQLLSRGYTVRATVRKATPANSGFLETLAAGLPGKIEIVEGADLTVEGSFDKAVSGANLCVSAWKHNSICICLSVFHRLYFGNPGMIT